ncbi:uncharacterized protein T551_03568 [Pneumocystis jirovecii RU7]|uniref:Endoplasmic reticulum-Golgi intermediate compartment protein n=1 Tax=Pneumocystis jirovecii (strain RU7) TaxID=1408657 RepID=A0A0W4ZCZ4_PNEJ7|nr:uncharacterized protein T551_03568 [Pneumocystis jirovecii RU7]KTW26269.1 hypothetical protein T551_03568 [Pneumocystis jirovecii RU7]
MHNSKARASSQEIQEEFCVGSCIMEYFEAQPGARKFPAFPAVKKLDFFRKIEPSYIEKSSKGGILTILWSIFLVIFLWREIGMYRRGKEEHQFNIEKEVMEHMKLNVDIVVFMPCDVIDVNVKDATSELILAGETLKKEGVRRVGALFETESIDFSSKHIPPIQTVKQVFRRLKEEELKPKGHVKDAPACRIYGSIDIHRVHGNFHITAQGHGYGIKHLSHDQMNFTHIIRHFSFGKHYSSIISPLDNTGRITDHNFYLFQYYISIIPTTYVKGNKRLLTNKYSVKEKSSEIDYYNVPGIVFLYDIEPISLLVVEKRDPFLRFLIRIFTIIGGLILFTEWLYKFTNQLSKIINYKKGYLHDRTMEKHIDEKNTDSTYL